MNFMHIFVVLICLANYASGSNPTYWIRKNDTRKLTVSSTTLKPSHDPTLSEVNDIMNCYHTRIWECAVESDLWPSQEFCVRLATNQPNESEKNVNGSAKFTAFRGLWIQLTGTDVHVPAGICYKPTDIEKQQVENCYFGSRSWRQKEPSKRTAHDSFCINLATDKPTAENVTMERLLAYRKVWAAMPDVGQRDYIQILECSPLKRYYGPFPELLSRDCFDYYELLKNPKTIRDVRRKLFHDCLDLNSVSEKSKHDCMCVLHTYRQMFYYISEV